MRIIFLLFLCITVTVGCNEEKEISYYNNPNVVVVEDETNTEFEIGTLEIKINNNRLSIKGEEVKNDVGLPHNLLQIVSFHLSPDQYLLAFDAMTEDGMKVYMFNVHSGERLYNISDEFNYDGYVQGYGLAWSPTASILAITAGYEHDPNSVRIVLYDAAHDLSKNASFIYQNIHGVKWDKNGEFIYYVVDTYQHEKYDKPPYKLYQTEVDSETFATTNIEEIEGLNEKLFHEWFQR
jgi:Tol biopolymer transport system component